MAENREEVEKMGNGILATAQVMAGMILDMIAIEPIRYAVKAPDQTVIERAANGAMGTIWTAGAAVIIAAGVKRFGEAK